MLLDEHLQGALRDDAVLRGLLLRRRGPGGAARPGGLPAGLYPEQRLPVVGGLHPGPLRAAVRPVLAAERLPGANPVRDLSAEPVPAARVDLLRALGCELPRGGDGRVLRCDARLAGLQLRDGHVPLTASRLGRVG
mgnify:CR=1 FL=1